MISVKDYEVWTAKAEVLFLPSLIDTILRGIGLRTGERKLETKETGFRTEEVTVIRTSKTEEEIKRYYNGKGLEVLSITECTRTKDQKLQII